MGVRTAAATVCLCALACSVLGRHAQEVRERMVGLPAQSGRECLGVPGYFDLEDGTELWVFAVPLPAQTQEIHIEVAQGPGTAWQPPRVTKGSPQRETRADTREAVLDDYGQIKANGRAIYFAARDWMEQEDASRCDRWCRRFQKAADNSRRLHRKPVVFERLPGIRVHQRGNKRD